MSTAAAGDVAIAADQLTKVFSGRGGDHVAVDKLSFTVRRHAITALLGPNGAGKTTTISMCEGFLTPTSGSVQVLGLNPATHPDQLRSRIGIMLQGGGAYPGIHAREMLALAASYSAHPLDVDWLLDVVGLTPKARTTYRGLSGGQQQRLSLACALVGRPELVILDEPTAGLDAQSRHLMWDLITSLRRDGVTVILTTHLLDEAEALAEDILIIDHGRLVAAGDRTSLRETVMAEQSHRIAITTAVPVHPADREIILAELATAVGVPPSVLSEQVTSSEDELTLTVPVEPTARAFAAIATTSANHDIPVTGLRAVQPSLEDIFLAATGTEVRA
ncbi:MAG: ABC transporter ATP-binding protein [Corynebacterium sp.]|nr:ABC transporter ATP-binding protein [Corynebacterium sp.]